ncbi:MAG: acyl-CoA dehydrogenase family protein [Alphaproteobacteria bacterium]|nr:acyl-CoA dehydrogenase family protein [Alphaproteobacteria bacterium]
MLDLFLDETHHALRDSAQAWVDRHIAPHAAQWEADKHFPRELHRAAAEAGLVGVTYPEAVGGAEGDVFHGLVVAEALIRGGSVGTAMGLGSHAISLPPILALGTPEQHQRFVAPVIRGEKVSCLAVTEPAAGSDVAGIRTRAVRDGDSYVIDGSKTFITSGLRADLAVVAARTGGDPDDAATRHDGISLFVVEKGTPGFQTGRALQKMGWHASDTAELFFEGCRVPAENLLGGEGAGFLGLMANFVSERLLLGVSAVATARMALEDSRRYCGERSAFRRPLHGFQVTRHRLAEMAAREAGARAFVATVAERHRRGEDVAADVAMAKNMACDACAFVTDAAVQLHGGMGYMAECRVERLFRDQRLYSIGGGTTEVMNEIIWRRGLAD